MVTTLYTVHIYCNRIFHHLWIKFCLCVLCPDEAETFLGWHEMGNYLLIVFEIEVFGELCFFWVDFGLRVILYEERDQT